MADTKKLKSRTPEMKRLSKLSKATGNSEENGRCDLIIPEKSAAKAFGMVDSTLLPYFLDQVVQSFRGCVSTDGLSEDKLNNYIEYSLVLIGEIQPRDGIEMMIVVQMLAVHNTILAMMNRAMITGQTFEETEAGVNRATKLLKTFTALLEALNKHRGKGHQRITVKHVTVEKGAQAIVGDVRAGEGEGG